MHSNKIIADDITSTLNIKVARKGSSQWQCHCPYHKDQTPSFSINPDKLVYKCFSCDRQGSLYKLYREFTGNTYSSDLKDDFTKFSLPTFYEKPTFEQLREQTRKITIDIRGVPIPYADSIKAKRYLRKRGINYDVADYFKLEYLDEGFVNGTYFKSRVLIPVFEKEKLISLEGRSVDSRIKPKVLYPSNSLTQTLMDIDSLDKTKPLYVVEGLTDLMVLRTDPFFKNSTSVFGASIGERQIALLDEFEEIIWLPNNDEAGERAWRKVKNNLISPRLFLLRIPNQFNDVGDMPRKARIWPETMRRRGWLKRLQKVH